MYVVKNVVGTPSALDFEVGDLVVLSASEEHVKKSLAMAKVKLANGTDIEYNWRDQMRGMLGKAFKIVEFNDDMVGMASPDGSQGGMWYFPKEVLMPPTPGKIVNRKVY